VELAEIAELSLREARRACDGLCASSAMRQAAVEPLSILVRLLQPGTPVGHHYLFADAAGVLPAAWTVGGKADDASAPGEPPPPSSLVASADTFAAMVRMWDILKLEPSLAQRQLAVGADFVLALGATRCSDATRRRLTEQLRLLRAPGPTIRGSAVAGVPGLPPHLRGLFISMLHVFCRLRAERAELDTAEALTAYLDAACDGLLDRLRSEWWEGGRWEVDADGLQPRLRAAYTKDATVAWQRAGVVLEER